jgi:glutathione S-transferase
MTAPYQLFGIPASLYTAKVRSYLIKQQIPFVERAVGDPHYSKQIQPVVGRMIKPVVEGADGAIVQDGADIIDYFEQRAEPRYPALPGDAVLAAVSYLFELFGGEGLLRPAMHYRWNFDDSNLAFLKDDFLAGLFPGADEDTKNQVFDFASGRMRKAASAFGITPDSIPLIESSYTEFLSLLSEHLTVYPYLLGGAPTLGDYGLIAPLYAHLGRDPYPAALMRQQAPKVNRWVERMNSPQQVAVEYGTLNEDLVSADDIPNTLKNLMRFIAAEYLPEITAHVAFANQWLAECPELEAGTNGFENPGRRFIGKSEFNWRGISLNTMVMPYRFYLLQRLQDGFEQAAISDQQAITALFNEAGLASILAIKTNRRVERVNNLEVWGPERNI